MSPPSQESRTPRCAIYTRKSTEEGLEQEFNTLDAQRDSGEAFATSQGWKWLPVRYDDGGYTGANMERPGLQRLIEDIKARKIDTVLVYKVDRLTRSLLDFSKLIELFDEYNVSFVSVTQLINTSNSMGRLMLNVLLSFAQFEREMISERTRDKIAATRRKGKWSGGMPVLGYTVVDTKLAVDKVEADRVRQIFALYLQLGSLIPVVKELNRRGWTTKQWITKKETRRGGCAFTKGRLYNLLTNVVYVGQVRYKLEVHEGEHEGIIDRQTFDQVQTLLATNGNGSTRTRNKYGALLRNLLYCGSCQCRMTHTYSNKRQKRYRYYTCGNAQQQGHAACPAPSVPAGEIEAFVVQQIKAIGRDPGILAATVAQVSEQATAALDNLQQEQAALERQRRGDETELRQLATAPIPLAQQATLLSATQQRIADTERRLTEIADELALLDTQQFSKREIAQELKEFESLWEALTSQEQIRVMELLIERIDYDGASGEISLTFHPTGIKALTTVEEHVA